MSDSSEPNSHKQNLVDFIRIEKDRPILKESDDSDEDDSTTEAQKINRHARSDSITESSSLDTREHDQRRKRKNREELRQLEMHMRRVVKDEEFFANLKRNHFEKKKESKLKEDTPNGKDQQPIAHDRSPTLKNTDNNKTKNDNEKSKKNIEKDNTNCVFCI